MPESNAPQSAEDASSGSDVDAKPTTEPSASSEKLVLIVDDDLEIVEAVRYALEGAGHQVLVARDGNQGLALAEREKSRSDDFGHDDAEAERVSCPGKNPSTA